MVGMGVIVADDALGCTLQRPHDVKTHSRVDLEAVVAGGGDVGAGLDGGDLDIAKWVAAADQEAAALRRVGLLGGGADAPQQRTRQPDHGDTATVPSTRPPTMSMTTIRAHGPGGPTCT